MERKMFAAAAAVWLLVIMMIMWLPASELGWLNLESPMVQGASFAFGAILLAFADRRRPPLWRRDQALGRFKYLIVRSRRHLLRIAALLAVYAAVLELGRWCLPGRSFRLSGFAANTAAIFAASAGLYALSRLFLGSAYLRRITERHLARVGAAYRREAIYAAYLRDMAQAAHAVCLSPSLPAADKVEEVRRLLDNALGAPLPNPDEEVLDTVFGAPVTPPLGSRPSLSRDPMPPVEAR